MHGSMRGGWGGRYRTSRLLHHFDDRAGDSLVPLHTVLMKPEHEDFVEALHQRLGRLAG
jgi:hypothetical protein